MRPTATAWWVVNPAADNVAVCVEDLPTGAIGPDGSARIATPVSRGVRVTLAPIRKGDAVVQYGSPFAVSRGIGNAETVRADNTQPWDSDIDADVEVAPPETIRNPVWAAKTFSGYDRGSGRVGTRNVYLIVPTSMCASDTAKWIADEVVRRWNIPACFPSVDGVSALTNTEGCGCAANLQIDRFLRVLRNFITHPNTAGVVVIDLGCEQTNEARMRTCLDLGTIDPRVPVDWLTIQREGGTEATMRRAVEIAARRLPELNAWRRTPCPVAALVVGTECGASDAFSGFTSNPLIGAVADRIISAGGSALLSEFPEMVGAERVLMRRMRSRAVIDKFRKHMLWYQKMAGLLEVRMSDNLVPENRAGGLINPCIKSLGAIVKGGSAAIEDVLDYGESLSQQGLSLMQGPGNDPESVTGIAASGANLILFSTGRGAVSGCALVPVVKISSNTDLYRRMTDDMDFDAGRLLREDVAGRESLVDELFDLALRSAGGWRTCAERHHQTQFQVWTAGKLSL